MEARRQWKPKRARATPGLKNYRPPKAGPTVPYKRGWCNGRIGHPATRNPWLKQQGVLSGREYEAAEYDRGWMDATGLPIPDRRIPYRPIDLKPVTLEAIE